ncbi:hypothetical protein SAMN02745704_02171 [Paucidesulfovibrio gracilis DSM 16080]|uniref:Uncharacterized protein n=1 Tax=Paucidesulfovibrio gracilis DSM 16080 TaxID=1121449 RepID=A0A1T4XJZ0_9BACT|nr:hypothetical protein SAMN02745704_02171 [Paucidesulfovibrio gracilis DSM 16080]
MQQYPGNTDGPSLDRPKSPSRTRRAADCRALPTQRLASGRLIRRNADGSCTVLDLGYGFKPQERPVPQ